MTFTIVYSLADGFIDDMDIEADSKEAALVAFSTLRAGEELETVLSVQEAR